MQTYSIGAFLKFTIGAIIVSILYKYVNIYESPQLGLSFGFLGIFMITRGAMYFFFLGLNKLRNNQISHKQQTSFSYKLSLFFALFVMTNLVFMINDRWTNFFGITSLLIFFLLIIFFGFDNDTKET